MPTPTVIDIAAYRFSDLDILQRVAERLSDGTMAFKVDILGGASITIGTVGLKNISGAQINPATDEALQAILAAILGQSGTPIIDYDEAVDSPVGAVETHTYTVTLSKKFSSGIIHASASGLMEVQVQFDFGSGLETKFTAHNSSANPVIVIDLRMLGISVAAAKRIVVLKKNRDTDPQSLYSTIVGLES